VAPRVAIVLNDDFALWLFFRGLIKELVARGVTVFAITPPGEYVARLEALGAQHVAVEFERFMNPIADLKTIWRLTRVLASKRVDLVCNITAKPIVFGGVAARLARVKRVVGMVEGLGYGFGAADTWQRRILRGVVSRMYRLGCRLTDRVGFANPDDRELFIAEGILEPAKAVAFRSMIGINVQEYSAAAVDDAALTTVRSQINKQPGEILITMIVSRQCWSKGVREFIEAAQRVSAAHTRARFLLVGPLDPKSPEAIPDEYLRRHASDRFQWITFSHHVREILHLSDIVVLPSYYREGLPVVLLEGLAMGKPIVTTDHVGCRETVEAGRNGLLVPIKDVDALAAAIERLVQDDELRQRFGRESRMIAERDFDQRAVIERVLAMWAIPEAAA